MPGELTGSSAAAALDYISGRALKYTAPFTVYLMLLTEEPSLADPTLTELAPTELTAPGYARQAVVWAPATWDETTGDATIANSVQALYGPFTDPDGTGISVVAAALTTAAAGTVGDVLHAWVLDSLEYGYAAQDESLAVAPGSVTMSLQGTTGAA